MLSRKIVSQLVNYELVSDSTGKLKIFCGIQQKKTQIGSSIKLVHNATRCLAEHGRKWNTSATQPEQNTLKLLVEFSPLTSLIENAGIQTHL